jgi:hypothetical protein
MQPSAPDPDFRTLVATVQAHFAVSIAGSPPLFRTDAGDLWPALLESLTDEIRPSHACSLCQEFVRRHGGLVTVEEDGSLRSAVWPAVVPPRYTDAARILRARLEEASITEVFLDAHPTWGEPGTLERPHLALHPPLAMRPRIPAAEAPQAMASLSREHALLLRALADLPLRCATETSASRWLLRVQEDRAHARTERAREALTWRELALAPTGLASEARRLVAPDT